MKTIGLYDFDKTNYPNLALMKLSHYYKSSGYKVEWVKKGGSYDRIFCSKVFTYTPNDIEIFAEAKQWTYGGSGYSLSTVLPDEIEHTCPDYNLYTGVDRSMGFVTRGCFRSCSWCIVREKEGTIKPHATVDEFLRHDKLQLLDNNILGHSHGIRQIEVIASRGVKVDFNQGLDARLIDHSVAKILAKVKFIKKVRLACDKTEDIEHVRKAIELMRWHNVTPRNYFVYVLVTDVDDALERVRFLKGMNCEPFAQPYRDREGTEPTQLQKDFARWVNHPPVFKSTTWETYEPRKGRPKGVAKGEQGYTQ
jgi:hypothetical protein